jgi:hypothetical protein
MTLEMEGVGGGAPDFEDGEAGGRSRQRASAPKAQPPGEFSPRSRRRKAPDIRLTAAAVAFGNQTNRLPP